MLRFEGSRIGRVILIAAALAASAPLAGRYAAAASDQKPAEPPASPIPSPPPSPRPPHLPRHGSAGQDYRLDEGQTLKGDQYLLRESVTIAGTLDGDLTAMAHDVSVPGTITRHANLFVNTAEVSGSIGDGVRFFGQSLRITGKVTGDVLGAGDTIIIEKDAVVTGEVHATGSRVEVRGKIEGDLEATGGEVVLAGQVGGDATLKGDLVTVDPSAHVKGDLDYTSRHELDIDSHKVAGGEVTFSPAKRRPLVSRHAVGWWFFKTITGLLFSLGAAAIFRKASAEIVTSVRSDGLRSAGIGFITAIVLPVALALSCIFIITIPAVLLAFLVYALLLYLAQAPVAIAVGDAILARAGRTAPSPFLSIAVGIPVLYLLAAIPYVGKLVCLGTVFTGFGAIVIAIWTARQARRGAVPPMATPPMTAAPAV